MPRLESKMKLGYYPLPPIEGDLIRQMLQFPSSPASVIDPCVGMGAALLQITSGANVSTYGVELDTDRAANAKAVGIDIIHGNVFETSAKSGQLSLLYLNPPYDSEAGSYNNERMEFLFLQHTYHWLVKRGVLLMVIPAAALYSCAAILANRFRNLRVYRLGSPEAEKYKQVAVFGVYDSVRGDAVEKAKSWLRYDCADREDLPLLQATDLPLYAVPTTPRAKVDYKGLPLDLIEDRLMTSPSWENISHYFTPGEGVEDARPLTPLHAGHIGLMCTSGLMNGVLGEGVSRHIAQWRSIKHIDEKVEFEEEKRILRQSERFSTELACVYQDGRVYLLTETPNQDPEITYDKDFWGLPNLLDGKALGKRRSA